MAYRERVRILADGTFISSKDGVSVGAAGLSQRSFDARFSAVGLAIGGTVAMGYVTSIGKPTSRLVGFTRTFGTSPPFFLYGWTLQRRAAGMFIPSRVNAFSNSNDTIGPRAEEVVEAEVYTNQVRFWSWFRSSDGFGKPTVRWRAFV